MNRIADLPTNGTHKPAPPTISAPPATVETRSGDLLDFAEAALIKLLHKLPLGWPPTGVVTVRIELSGTVALLKLGSASDIAASERGPDPLIHRDRPPCQRATLRTVLAEVATRRRRITGAEVLEAMKAAGRSWGMTTINRALAELVADGLLVNEHDGRGYGPPGDDAEGGAA